MPTQLLKLSLCLLCFFVLGAWDTKEHHASPGTSQTHGDKHKWQSIYVCLNGGGNCARNEHELVSQMALDTALKSNPWRIGQRTDFSAIDLNASFFRPDLTKFPARDTGTKPLPLEQRILPAPPHYAGVPDFSYTIYDWINKNTLCPPRPATSPEPDYCHVFGLWHGAGFNASHFGSQATRSYLKLHGTALLLADNAAKMLDAAKTPEDRAAHMMAIREAEYLALAYEAYAQHFFGDRWAMGHMIERWGAPEYNRSAYGDDLGNAIAPGIIAGLVHGYESVVKEHIPDAMSSPEYLTEVSNFSFMDMYTPEWRFDGETNIYGGVGDYRFQDMNDGAFGKEYAVRGYKDYPLTVHTQKGWMMKCLAAGFGEVISRFGRHPDGGIGIDQVELTGRGSDKIDTKCFKAWATNYAVNIGWGTEGKLVSVTNAGKLARYAPRATTDVATGDLVSSPAALLVNVGVDTTALVSISAKIAWRAYWDPTDIDLAQGNLPAYGQAKTGNNYSVASYLEPTDLSSLPRSDAKGRDQETIFGLFNRAGAGYFCSQPEDYLDIYRRAAEDKDRAMCRLMAHRMYKSTWEKYTGQQSETQSVHFRDAGHDSNPPESSPLCEIAPGSWKPPSSQTDDIPYELHPGYVSWDPFAKKTKAYYGDQWELSTLSIASWCDAVPVIDTGESEEDISRDIVARIISPDDDITLTGLNFGRAEGEIRIGQTPTASVVVDNIKKWSNREIKFDLTDIYSKISFNADSETFLFITRPTSDDDIDHGAKSVGRFVLFNDVPRPKIAQVELSRGKTIFMSYEMPAETPKDPGPHAENLPEPPEPGPFRPINPGSVDIEIKFDRDMAQGEEGEEFKVGNDILTGEWANKKTWRGKYELLADDFFHRRLGYQKLSIQAKAKDGGWIDFYPEQPGDQPDESLSVLIDDVPIFVTDIDVKDSRKTLYSASWIGGPNMAKAPNLTQSALGDPRRNLSVKTRNTPPTEGTASIRLTLSSPVLTPPTLSIGGTSVELNGEDTDWRGEFELVNAHQGMKDDRIAIKISATDNANKGLDGDPRTVTQIKPPGSRGGHWARYETKRGGQDARSGGTDDWHFLAAPVDLSLAIILDASGSMGDDTGRMENAKQGIATTLDGLPEDRIVEVAGVIFYSCSSISEYAFTRNIANIKSFFMGASPSGATALAKSHYVAGKLFDSSADPASPEWRFSSFTDGEETCGGNVAGAARYLDAKIMDHKGALRERPPEPPEPVKPLEEVECKPTSWRSYKVNHTPARPFDDIGLTEYWYLERALPDGRCFARLETRDYGVYYGAGSAGSGWGINSKPSEVKADFGTSSKGVKDLDRVRNLAQSTRRGTSDLPRARTEIAKKVQAQLERD